MNWLTPGSRANAIERLYFDLVLSPLFQILDGKLSLQSIRNDVGQDATLWSMSRILYPVSNQLWIAIVFPLWQRLKHKHSSIWITIRSFWTFEICYRELSLQIKCFFFFIKIPNKSSTEQLSYQKHTKGWHKTMVN